MNEEILREVEQTKQLRITIPKGWNEVTVKQFVQLNCEWDSKDIVKLISILSGIDEEIIFCSEDTELEKKVLPRLEWMKQSSGLPEMKTPDKITIDEKEYFIPGDLGLKTFGQKVCLDEEIRKNHEAGGDITSVIPYAIAVYLYPIVSGKPFNEEEAIKFMNEVVMDLKIFDVYPIGIFFLKKLNV